jgi:TonB family protein
MGVGVLRSPIALSLAVHAFLIACFIALSQQAVQVTPSKLTWIELEPVIQTKSANKNDIRKQIVQTERGEKVEKAPEKAFLGERNQRVDRETVNKNRTTAIGKTNTPPVARVAEGLKPETRQIGPLSKLGIPIIPSRPKEHRDTPQWSDMAGSPQDFVNGLRESERTALNTKEYVFYGYFQRIRERLDRAWIPILRERLTKIYKSGRRLASEMDHATKVVVVLNDKGEIIKVQVVNESGVQDLDEAAINAFNAAGPFPNPPKGIVDPNGQIQIPWEFVLRT